MAPSPLAPAQIKALLLGQYRVHIPGNVHWLTVHWADHQTPFGEALLTAMIECEVASAGLGFSLTRDLANIAYVPASRDPNGWRAGFQQLLQKLAEIVVVRALVRANWPSPASFVLEPRNPHSGRRPELKVETADRIYLFEVKCPSLLAHQEARAQNPNQVPARNALGNYLRAQEGALGTITWPRDNVFKDFLVSAEEKFAGFSDKPTFAALVVLWDAHMYEPISSLLNAQSGLLTENSFHQADGERVPYGAVDGVFVLHHLAVLQAGAQEQPYAHRHRPFRLDQDDAELRNVWCPNLGGQQPELFLMSALDAVAAAEMAHEPSYRAQEFIMWFNV